MALPARQHPTRAALWTLATVVALLTLNWLCAVARFQVNVLTWDQWDFMDPLFRGDGWWGLFSQQHGPHRQGLGFVLTSWVMAASGWDSRIDSVWIVSLLTVSAVLALRLKWALTGTLRVTDVWIPLIVLTLGQVDTVITTPNASHSVFPLMLLLAAANLWLSPRITFRYLSVGFCAFALLFTGFGIFGGLMLTALLAGASVRSALAKRGNECLWACGGLAIALVGLTVFARGYAFQPASEGFRFPFDPWTDYVRFAVLMLAHPTGLHGATAAAYATGTIVAFVAMVVSFGLVWRWLRARDEPLATDAYLLLLGAGLGFAVNTAVGRVHLGIDGGMVSRYITLLTPIPLACGLWAATRPSAWNRRLLLAGVWAIALWPFVDLASRPVADWPGTAGLTTRIRSDLDVSTESKQTWVSTYLETGDWRKADALAGAVIHPFPIATRLEEKLAWLKERRLSFFAHPEATEGYFPWLTFEKAVWLQAYSSEGSFRWMGRTAKLTIFSKQRGFANVRVLGRESALPPDAALRFTHLGRDGIWRFSEGAPALSLPVSEGVTTITFESIAGAVRPVSHAGNANDDRKLSFQLAPVSLSTQPEGSEWTLDPAAGEWRIVRGWRPVAGLYNWERDGAFVWAGDPLVIEATVTTQDAYLNLHIERRFSGVDTGPVEISCDGRRTSFGLTPDGGGFSLSLPPRGKPYRIEIHNTSGAKSPAELGLSEDQRPLALKIDRLTIDTQPAYPEISLR